VIYPKYMFVILLCISMFS